MFFNLWIVNKVVDLKKKRKERKRLEKSSKETTKQPLILLRTDEEKFGWLDYCVVWEVCSATGWFQVQSFWYSVILSTGNCLFFPVS